MDRGSILFVRHAQSAANAGGRTSEAAAIPLTELGRRQAELLAEFLHETPRLVVTSKFSRTMETAQPLLLRRPGVPVEEWAVQEFTYLDPLACVQSTYSERKSLRDAYWNRRDAAHVDGVGCESFDAFIARLRRLKSVLAGGVATRPVVIFTHAFVMKGLVWLRNDAGGPLGPEDMRRFDTFRRNFPVQNCAVLHGTADRQRGVCVADSIDASHLPAALRTE